MVRDLLSAVRRWLDNIPDLLDVEVHAIQSIRIVCPRNIYSTARLSTNGATSEIKCLMRSG